MPRDIEVSEPNPPASTPRAKPESRYLPTLTWFLLVVIAAWAGMQAAREYLVPGHKERGLIQDAFRLIRTAYVAKVEPRGLAQGAIRGMVLSLADPHCAYLPPVENKLVQQAQHGEIGGVGIEIAFRDGEAVVIAPVDGMPAQKAGVLPGDVIVEVDGKSCRGLDVRGVANLIRGVIGTQVSLGVRRSGEPEPLRFKLKRVKIQVSNVRSRMLDGGVGLVRIALFSDRVGADFRTALATLAEQKMRGLVLDLRFNPGGVVDEAVAVVDALIDDGVIVSTKSRHKDEVGEHRASKKNTACRVPMVVLVNQGTASASEIVAGALQDHGRATIIGVKTFGKGVVSKTLPLHDGSSVALTVAKYYTPKGRSIEGTGLEPDLHVAEAKTPAPRTDDKALDKAVEFLKKRL